MTDAIALLSSLVTEFGYTTSSSHFRPRYHRYRFLGRSKKPLTITQLGDQEVMLNFLSDYYLYGSLIVNLADPDSIEKIGNFIRAQGGHPIGTSVIPVLNRDHLADE
jgi:hypothetical protein